MIQTDLISLQQRERSLRRWLEQHFPLRSAHLATISADASFRRYFRWTTTDPLAQSQQTIIAVDAPPAHENCRAFVAIASGLLARGLNVPVVYKVDYEQGFMALGDLGDKLLLHALNPENVNYWYTLALEELAGIQIKAEFPDYRLADYSETLLLSEMKLFTDWFLPGHLNYKLSSKQTAKMADLYEKLIQLARHQPQVTVHLDYHSRNLMVIENKKLGIIDFQDAVIGPITYDLISLIKDCYVRWPQKQIDRWMLNFKRQQAVLRNVSDDEFIYWADTMSMQRHIKVAGIFSRLFYRDGKAAFLADIPLTLDYLKVSAQRHAEFNWFGKWIADELYPLTLEKNAKQHE